MNLQYRNVAFLNLGEEHRMFTATDADPRIEEAHSVAGNSNFLLKVRVADPNELEDVLHDLYRVEGVVRSRTIMVLRRGFERGVGLP